ncbi:MAG TPA: hypothetical protein VMN56_01350 [Casimicrobiaceae bacterium]|nr:hypothetical protein [Casimicrobiaceae bacterium]
MPRRYGRASRADVVRWETRGVLAGAYRGTKRGGGQRADKATLTHALGLDAAGNEVMVGCRGVQVDNLCDVPLETEPTCPRCRAALVRRR